MSRIPFLVWAVLFASLVTSSATAVESIPGEHPALSVGEELTFAVKWGIVQAGTATMGITERKDVSGHDCFHVVATAISNPVFDKIYPVRDRFESFMDAKNLQSWAFKKHLREGKFRRDQVARSDHEAQKTYYHDGKSYDMEKGAYDILSAFYFIRTSKLEPGMKIELSTHTDRKNYPIRVSVLKRERVEVPAGTFDCIIVEPALQSGAFFQGDGNLKIWLTDDERRMPVKMKGKIPVGSISVVLESYERGGNPK